MSKWYWLDEDKRPWPVLADFDTKEGLGEFKNYNDWLYDPENKRVSRTQVDEYDISTVFLGFDHSFNGDTPILWETMIFDDKGDVYMRRYMSHEDALNGHNKIVELMGNEFTERQLLDG